MNKESAVLLESDEGVATITLNRPDTLNSLDYPMALALREAIDSAAALSPRVVILKGAGVSFCGGGDVGAMHENRHDLPAYIARMIDAFHGSIMALRRLPMPVIGAVQGAVAGGGFSMAMACDLVVAATNARFVVAYPRLGAPADGGLSFQLAQKLGPMRALETLTLHGSVMAEDALRMGLINRTVEAGELASATAGWAKALSALPQQPVTELKGLVSVLSADALEQHLEREKAAFLRCAASEDFASRVAAFASRQRGQR